jgi:GTP pyrophosphokinase
MAARRGGRQRRAVAASSATSIRATRRWRSRSRSDRSSMTVTFCAETADPVETNPLSTLDPMAVVDTERHHENLVGELLATIEVYNPDVDRELIRRAFDYAEQAHRGQTRRSGEEFIHHPWGVAQNCAQLHLDEQTIAAALLHDVVEDTDSALDDLRAEFGSEIAQLVEGVTKLTRIQFSSREQAEAENYRKMIVAMAQDVRVILIKLADRLHNMRTIEYLGRQKQVQKAKETLEVYAPLAHRLGIHALKWELEDLSFQILHPRKYAEIKAMVADRRADREAQVEAAAAELGSELEKADIPADISGRAKHFYSIYDKMAKKGKEFNEIYDLTAMRVIVERGGEEGTRDCYGALGILHSLWKPMPGRFKDFVAMPKLNRYRSLHTTVIGPNGSPLEIQVRTREMHEEAEYGVAAHWLYKRGRAAKGDDEWVTWVKSLMDWQGEETDPSEYMRTLRTDLFDDEVYVFTPKGEVKTLPAGATPIDFAYAVHTDVGHRTVGSKVNGRIVPLHYRLRNGDFVEILTSKSGRGPSRDWMGLAASSRARNKIRQWFQRETRGETEAKGREALDQALKAQNLPYRKLQGSTVLAQVIREVGFKKAEDFYVALGSGKLGTGQIVNKVLQRLKTDEVAAEPAVSLKPAKSRRVVSADGLGIVVPGVETGVLVRLANCCTPVPGDDIAGYISLGRGITIHRRDCPNVRSLMRNPERFTEVEWEGGASTSFKVQIAVEAWDRPRLLEDVARTFSEHGANIVAYGGTVDDGMARNWYTAELGDVKDLRSLLSALRNLEAVFDSYRMTPGG